MTRDDVALFLANNVVNRIPWHSLRIAYYRRVMKFELAPDVVMLLGTIVGRRGGLTIGAHSVINERCRLDSRGELLIGENVSISSDAIILTADHDIMVPGFPYREHAVRIEDHVFIGTRALVLPGVTIGRGAVVGSGAVVARDVPALEIVAGVPARSVGRRPPDALDYELAWRPALR